MCSPFVAVKGHYTSGIDVSQSHVLGRRQLHPLYRPEGDYYSADESEYDQVDEIIADEDSFEEEALDIIEAVDDSSGDTDLDIEDDISVDDLDDLPTIEDVFGEGEDIMDDDVAKLTELRDVHDNRDARSG